MIGGLQPNKGVGQLLEAYTQLKLQSEDRILLVGKMAKPIREMIEGSYSQLLKDKRLVCVDRYVTDFELGCGFLASDVVTVIHERLIGSSGTLVRAAHADRPLLTTDYGWAGWSTERFDLGKTVNVVNFEALKNALEDSFKNRPPSLPLRSAAASARSTRSPIKRHIGLRASAAIAAFRLERWRTACLGIGRWKASIRRTMFGSVTKR